MGEIYIQCAVVSSVFIKLPGCFVRMKPFLFLRGFGMDGAGLAWGMQRVHARDHYYRCGWRGMGHGWRYGAVWGEWRVMGSPQESAVPGAS